jgi:hypothetical protein
MKENLHLFGSQEENLDYLQHTPHGKEEILGRGWTDQKMGFPLATSLGRDSIILGEECSANVPLVKKIVLSRGWTDLGRGFPLLTQQT